MTIFYVAFCEYGDAEGNQDEDEYRDEDNQNEKAEDADMNKQNDPSASWRWSARRRRCDSTYPDGRRSAWIISDVKMPERGRQRHLKRGLGRGSTAPFTSPPISR